MTTAEEAAVVNFPYNNGDKIPLKAFLTSSKGLVATVDDLGTFFVPLSYDISSNVQKLEKAGDRWGVSYLDDLIVGHLPDAEDSGQTLVWLIRSLNFFLVFYQCLIDEPGGPESLQDYMEVAYNAALRPHHGWFTRAMFSVFKRACPSRVVVMEILRVRMNAGDSDDHAVLEKLQELCTSLSATVHHIIDLYTKHGLNTSYRAP